MQIKQDSSNTLQLNSEDLGTYYIPLILRSFIFKGFEQLVLCIKESHIISPRIHYLNNK